MRPLRFRTCNSLFLRQRGPCQAESGDRGGIVPLCSLSNKHTDLPGMGGSRERDRDTEMLFGPSACPRSEATSTARASCATDVRAPSASRLVTPDPASEPGAPSCPEKRPPRRVLLLGQSQWGTSSHGAVSLPRVTQSDRNMFKVNASLQTSASVIKGDPSSSEPKFLPKGKFLQASTCPFRA